jgi:hypothetical protein
MADFLRPIAGGNRDEYILVEFHRTLKNTNMALLNNLFARAKDDPELMQIFPKLIEYAKMTSDTRYDASVVFNKPRDLIFNLSGEKLSEELCQQYADAFKEPYKFPNLHTTRMEVVLHHLCEQDFVKKLYIFADKFSNEMKAYVAQTFGDVGVGTRVVALEGNLEDCLLSMPEITTVFMSNFSDLEPIYKSHMEVIKGKYIIISHGYGNMVPSQDHKRLEYAGMRTFAKWHKKKIADVAYGYPYAIYRAI